MLRTWQRIKAELVRKYQPDYPKSFFKAFGHNLKVEELFEKTLRHKGLHGVLLPGLYGYAYQPDMPIEGRRVLEQFISHIDLPLRTSTQLQAPNAAAPGQLRLHQLRLHVEGRLNQAAFRDDDLRRTLRAMADDPLLKVKLTVACTEDYLLDADTGWLRAAELRLVVEVPGIYRNELHHWLETVDCAFGPNLGAGGRLRYYGRRGQAAARHQQVPVRGGGQNCYSPYPGCRRFGRGPRKKTRRSR